MKTLLALLTAAALLIGLLGSAAFAQPPPTPTVIQFAQDSFLIEEANLSGRIDFSVGLITANTGLSFRIQITGGTATGGVDYPANMHDQLIQFPYGSTPFEVIDDGVHEPDETLELTLSDPGPNIVFGPRAKTVVTIRNSPTTLLLHYPHDFGEQTGAENRQIVIERRGDRESVTSVDLAFTPGGGPPGSQDATPGVDYRADNQRVDFTSGERERQVTVQILDDGEVEGPEWLTATLSNPSPGTILLNEKTLDLHIGDNEHAANYDVTEPWPDIRPFVLLDEGEIGYRQVHPLAGGGKFISGWFNQVNGIERRFLARLDSNDELDPTFRFDPPADFADFLHPSWNSVLALRSGGVLVRYWDRSDEEKIIVLSPNGSLDQRFDLADLSIPEPFAAWSEGVDGTIRMLFTSYGRIQDAWLIQFRPDGSPLPVVKLAVNPDHEHFRPTLLADGSTVIIVFEPLQGRGSLRRFTPDGALDTSFREVWGMPVSSLPDGRFIAYGWGFRLIHPNGAVDMSVPPLRWLGAGDGALPGPLLPVGDRLFDEYSGVESVFYRKFQGILGPKSS